MAAQTSLLPVYHQPQDPNKASELNMDVDLSRWITQQPTLQDEAFLQELLSGQGVRRNTHCLILACRWSMCTHRPNFCGNFNNVFLVAVVYSGWLALHSPWAQSWLHWSIILEYWCTTDIRLWYYTRWCSNEPPPHFTGWKWRLHQRLVLSNEWGLPSGQHKQWYPCGYRKLWHLPPTSLNRISKPQPKSFHVLDTSCDGSITNGDGSFSWFQWL